jgi:hypothetical protein
MWWGEVGRGPLSENHLICRLQGLDNSCSCAEDFVYIKGSYQLYKLGIYLSIYGQINRMMEAEGCCVCFARTLALPTLLS